MVKKTLFFGNPAYLSTQNEQLVVNYPNDGVKKQVPIEDIGFIVLEHPQITITNKLLEKITQNNVALINCDASHHPIGLLMPLDAHTEQSERFKYQISATKTLKKNLWKQTVVAKIKNQAELLKQRGIPHDNMLYWAERITSGDPKNQEARSAVYYWKQIFKMEFIRGPNEEMPNGLLNYGYAILRALIARSLVSSGLLPTLGIFHKNKYNAYCLADDIMEPYRPFVDRLVCDFVDNQNYEELTIEHKKHLLQIITMDVMIGNKQSPLMIASSRTTNSLYECFKGVSRKILYPKFI